MRRHVLALVLSSACGGQPTVASGERGQGPEDVVPAAAQPAGSCDDAPVATLEQIADGAHDGARIAVDLVPESHGSCTEMSCNDGDCCNRCEGTYGAALRREPPSRALELELQGFPGCSGMECNVHCEPFGRRPSTAYRFVGTNTFAPAGVTAMFNQSQFIVEKYCRVAP